MDNMKIPAPIQEAKHQLMGFECIDGVSVDRITDDAVFLKTEWRVSLPLKFSNDKVSNTGVRDTESVLWEFGTNYPLSAPIPRLRSDFPVDLPHIYPIIDGLTPFPCISELPLLELLHSKGLSAIVGAMKIWLMNAAAGTLQDPIQGWEPIRRDSQSGAILTNTGALTAALSESYKSVRFYRFSYFLIPGKESAFIGRLDERECSSQSNPIKSKDVALYVNLNPYTGSVS